MSTLLWVLAGLVAYTLAAMALKARGLLPDAVRVQGPLMTVHTRRGRAFLDRLAGPRRFWRAWSNVGIGIALVLMAAMFVLLVAQGVAILRNPPAPSTATQPESFLVIPGLNPFLPLEVAPEIVFGLLIGLVVHEGGHGLLCRVEGIDIESMGVVLLTLVPVGAFVEPDEESQSTADRGSRTRMFAAGVTNNFALAAVAFALLFGPVVGAIAPAPGVPIAGTYDGAPASGVVGQGDRITTVDGTPVDSERELDEALLAAGDRTVEVEVDGERTGTVRRELLIVGTIADNPAGLSVEEGQDPIRVTAVDGAPVHTRGEFREAVGEDAFATLSTSEGEVTVPVGAYVVRATDDGPLAAAGAPTDEPLIVTRFGGERIVTQADLQSALAATEPGADVEVEVYRDGERETYAVSPGEAPDGEGAFLGVQLFPGTGGLVLTDFGVDAYPAGTYLELLGGDGGGDAVSPADLGPAFDSAIGLVFLTLVLPLASVVLGIPNFPGFTAATREFYVVEGPLSVLGGGVFLLANALFWTAWINLNLGLFNCIPGYPLDGGRILRTSTEAVVARLPVGRPEVMVRSVTVTVGLTMLAALLVMIFVRGG